MHSINCRIRITNLYNNITFTRFGTTFLSVVLLVVAVVAGVPAYAQQALYVANYGNNTIEEFNSSGIGTVFASGGLLDNPTALAFYGANLYVANFSGGTNGLGTIEEFNSKGVGTLFASGGLLGQPDGLAFDSSGNLYVANSYGFNGTNYSGTIEKFNSNGVGTQFNVSGLTVDIPAGLAFDSSGNLYVANLVGTQQPPNNPGFIEKFNSNGDGTLFAGSLSASGGLLDDPDGLAFDSSGNLYVSNAENATINEYNGSGDGTLFANTLTIPRGLAFDSSGNLYAAIQTGAIKEFNSSGVGTEFGTSGVDEPYGLAFGPTSSQSSATPEPGSLALLTGLGIAGSCLLIRRRCK